MDRRRPPRRHRRLPDLRVRAPCHPLGPAAPGGASGLVAVAQSSSPAVSGSQPSRQDDRPFLHGMAVLLEPGRGVLPGLAALTDHDHRAADRMQTSSACGSCRPDGCRTSRSSRRTSPARLVGGIRLAPRLGSSRVELGHRHPSADDGFLQFYDSSLGQAGSMTRYARLSVEVSGAITRALNEQRIVGAVVLVAHDGEPSSSKRPALPIARPARRCRRHIVSSRVGDQDNRRRRRDDAGRARQLSLDSRVTNGCPNSGRSCRLANRQRSRFAICSRTPPASTTVFSSRRMGHTFARTSRTASISPAVHPGEHPAHRQRAARKSARRCVALLGGDGRAGRGDGARRREVAGGDRRRADRAPARHGRHRVCRRATPLVSPCHTSMARLGRNAWRTAKWCRCRSRRARASSLLRRARSIRRRFPQVAAAWSALRRSCCASSRAIRRGGRADCLRRERGADDAQPERAAAEPCAGPDAGLGLRLRRLRSLLIRLPRVNAAVAEAPGSGAACTGTPGSSIPQRRLTVVALTNTALEGLYRAVSD